MTGSVQTIRFGVEGIMCSSCSPRIVRALRRLPGVTTVRVDLRGETASVTRDPAVATDAAITHALIAAGYRPDLTGATPPGRPTTRTDTRGEQQ